MSRAPRRTPAPNPAPPPPTRRDRARLYETAALVALSLAVLWVYCPLELLRSGNVLYGGDFSSLHQRRLEFARDALFGPDGQIPAWYPRELLGTPFWSNLQNFPLIPTRLPMLLFDPWYVHGIGVNFAAVLAAAFTYLFCRRLGLGPLGSATAGWTFACAGFFAARVLAGHFPLLEAYPALPLLLWLAERCAAAGSPRQLRLNLLALAVAAGCVMVAGHPQIPVYAVGATVVYLAARLPLRRFAVAAGAVAAGVACASFVLFPMLRLIGRSTRVLSLDRAANDVPFPAWRLKAFLFPWADGWPANVVAAGERVPFTRGEEPLFWETVCYVGWLPLLAAAFLAARVLALRGRPRPDRRWLVIALIGAAALVLALPVARSLLPGGPWTILRSPARQVYLTTFALALAAGVAVHLLWRRFADVPSARVRAAGGFLVAAVLLAHALDLRNHAAKFLRVIAYPEVEPPQYPQNPEGARVAIDFDLVHPLNRRIDDVGVFDSILLAPPYRAMLALAGWSPTTNRQFFDGSELGPRALAWAGATDIATVRPNLPGLRFNYQNGPLFGYAVPNPLPRAGFVPSTGARYLDDESVYEALRAGATPDRSTIFLPRAADRSHTSSPAAQTTSNASPPDASVRYTRISNDDMQVDVQTTVPGYLRVLESWDPGWRATVDGRPAELFLADGFVMAVPLTPGSHVVRLTYSTPGVLAGVTLSAGGVLGLLGLLAGAPRLWFPAVATAA